MLIGLRPGEVGSYPSISPKDPMGVEALGTGSDVVAQRLRRGADEGSGGLRGAGDGGQVAAVREDPPGRENIVDAVAAGVLLASWAERALLAGSA